MSHVEFPTQTTLAANIAHANATAHSLAPLAPALNAASQLIFETLSTGRKILACGNGGSASDSAHFTAEIAGRFLLPRPGFAAIDLTSQHALLTALSNDYPPEQAFARMVAALGSKNDLLIVFSTSGKSPNIRLALDAAKSHHLKSIAFLGRDGGTCRNLADVELLVPGTLTARIQEAHLLLYHTLCELLDPLLSQRARMGEHQAEGSPR